MVGDDISAVDNRLKVLVGGVMVNLTFADSDTAVNCGLLLLTLLVSRSSQIPVPESAVAQCFEHHDSDPRTASNKKKKLLIFHLPKASSFSLLHPVQYNWRDREETERGSHSKHIHSLHPRSAIGLKTPLTSWLQRGQESSGLSVRVW